MRYRLLGKTGLRVSELCLGRMIFGDARGSWGASREEAERILQAFAEAGGNFVDTANHYARGESERILGELIAPDRERWVLATKYGLSTRSGDPNGGGAHRKSLVRSLDESLKRLGTDYVDLYWVHIWDAFTPVEEVVRALNDVVRSGKALYVGVSDTPAWIVSRAVALAEERGLERINALQVPYSLVERTVERQLLPMARALDLAVTTWAPLGGGLLTGRYGTDRARPEDSRLAGIGGRHEENATSGRNPRDGGYFGARVGRGGGAGTGEPPRPAGRPVMVRTPLDGGPRAPWGAPEGHRGVGREPRTRTGGAYRRRRAPGTPRTNSDRPTLHAASGTSAKKPG